MESVLEQKRQEQHCKQEKARLIHRPCRKQKRSATNVTSATSATSATKNQQRYQRE
jgi:hypothetical protein